jgi:trans-aconitate methyltransferase
MRKRSNDFTSIAAGYSDKSVIQQSASDILIGLLRIQPNDSVLDVGCGTGKITRKLSTITRGMITGIDPSPGMIKSASRENSETGIRFRVLPAEEISCSQEFDIIFCNSAMQWFTDIDRVFSNFHTALKPGGKIGIQAPAREEYCPNFLKGIERVRLDKRTAGAFSTFRNPWLFYNNEDEYRQKLEQHGFEPDICRIDRIETKHTPEEVFRIFSSGAAAGYLNREYYGTKLSPRYINSFNGIMKDEFDKQAGEDGRVDLVFFRIYIVANKAETNL